MGRCRRRTVAALVYAAVGLVIPLAWYGPVVVHGRPVLWLLYLGFPGLAAACVGAAGAPLLAAPRCTRAWTAALSGVGLALLAFALSAVLFAAGVKLTEPDWSSVLGLALVTMMLGLLVAGWAVVVLGAVAGWIVWRLSRDGAPPDAP